MSNNNAIGVFDSGLGGLTTVKELQNILPNENIIYFGDTGRVPYGTKSRETIIKYAMQDIAFLRSKNVKFIIAACGTVSSIIDELVEAVDIPFIGVVKPTAISAARHTVNKKIGIIGTSATIESKSYAKALLKIDPTIRLFEQACPLFASMIESGFIDESDPIVIETVQRYLSSLKNKEIDTLVLGCTHYPLISEAIRKVIGYDVLLIDSGRETAQYAKQLLEEKDLLNTSNAKTKLNFFVSDSVEIFSNTAKTFLGEEISESIQKINIETF